MDSVAQMISILYVEDDDVDVRIARRALQKGWNPIGPYQDYRLHHANTLREGMDEYQALQPHIVLLNLNLPDSCGVATLERFMANDPTALVVVLTGDMELGLIPQLIQAGAAALLSKVDLAPLSLNLTIRCAMNESRSTGQNDDLSSDTDLDLTKSLRSALNDSTS